jgi:hypothetical protein
VYGVVWRVCGTKLRGLVTAWVGKWFQGLQDGDFQGVMVRSKKREFAIIENDEPYKTSDMSVREGVTVRFGP